VVSFYLTRPWWLLLLLVLPPLVALAVVRRRARVRLLNGMGWDPRRVPRVSGAALTASVFLILALAGLGAWWPGWDQREARDLVLVVDVSRSMAAEDAVPDRLTVARKAAATLLDELGRQPGTRVGLVAFAGRAVVRAPLTENLGAVRRALDRLTPGSVQPGGSDLGAGIESAVKLLAAGSREPGGAIVLLSDGEDHAGNLARAILESKTNHVAVHAIAIGDPDIGSTIPIRQGTGRTGSVVPAVVSLTYRGEVVETRRMDAGLEQAATATDGRFLAMGRTTTDLGPIDRSDYVPAARRVESELEQDRASRYVPWAAFSALLSLTLMPGLRHLTRSGRWAWTLLLAMVVAPGLTAAGRPPDPGLRAYQAGRWQEALRFYRRSPGFHRRDPAVLFNAGACAYQLGLYEESAALYQRAGATSRGLLRLKSRFAEGNALVPQGRLAEALASYETCLADPTTGPAAEALKRDAETNRDFVRDLLDRRAGQSDPEADAAHDQVSRTAQERRARSGEDDRTQRQRADNTQADAASKPPGEEADPTELPNRAPDQSRTPGSQSSPAERWRQALEAVEQGRSPAGAPEHNPRPNLETRDW
jgi:Ca-activated chloride channel family protein